MDHRRLGIASSGLINQDSQSLVVPPSKVAPKMLDCIEWRAASGKELQLEVHHVSSRPKQVSGVGGGIVGYQDWFKLVLVVGAHVLS